MKRFESLMRKIFGKKEKFDKQLNDYSRAYGSFFG